MLIFHLLFILVLSLDFHFIPYQTQVGGPLCKTKWLL